MNWMFWRDERIDVLVFDVARLTKRIERNEALFQKLFLMLEKQMSALDDLIAAVAEEKTASESIVVLVNGLSDKVDELTALIEAGGSFEEIKALTQELRDNTARINAAVAENTLPAEG